ncbi:MAG TPA: hypothetical protein VGF14_00205 [Alphaproteobacteria bacterium]
MLDFEILLTLILATSLSAVAFASCKLARQHVKAGRNGSAGRKAK